VTCASTAEAATAASTLALAGARPKRLRYLGGGLGGIMSNELITDADTRPTGTGANAGRSAARSGGRHRDDNDGARSRAHRDAELRRSLRPFTDPAEARSVGSACRAMLGRHIEPPALLDSIAVVLAAKAIDEADGDLAFAAIPDEPRRSASRFDHLIRDALGRLDAGVHGRPDVDVPELVAHQVLRDLGPYSLLLTAEQPGGRDTLRALFLGAAGGEAAPRRSPLDDPGVAAAMWQVVPSSAPSMGAVTEAAAVAFDGREHVADHDRVLDLRDPDPSRPSRHRHRRT